MIARLWLQHLCSITLVRILEGFVTGQPTALHCIGARCLEDSFAPAQPDSQPFCLQGKSRPASCTVTFPTLPDVPLSHAAQETGPGGKEAGMAPPHVQGFPGDSRHDGGMSLPSTGHAGWWQGQTRLAPCC